jgi:hypothetical protein
MGKPSANRPAARGARSAAGGLPKGSVGRTKVVHLAAKTDPFVIGKARFEATMLAAEQSGLLSKKSSRIGGRVSPALVRQAKRQTGIEANTDLIEFALATIALEDNFADSFRESRGKVDPELKLGF